MKHLKTNAAVLSLLASCSALAAAPEPNPLIGTWKLNLEQSIAPQGSRFDPFTVVTKRADTHLDFTYTATDRHGKPVTFSYNAIADGVERAIPSSVTGLKATNTRLPSGAYESGLRMPDGSYENKFCQVDASRIRMICMAAVTQADGSVVFFKQVLDKQ